MVAGGHAVAQGTYAHELDLEVRDYECDLQGVVNNANYQHYIEHARHNWLEALGIDFAALHDEGVDLVVARLEIDFKYPLRSRDRFVVRSSFAREGRLRLIFSQDIYRKPDDKLIVQARVVGAAVRGGKPVPLDLVSDKLAAAFPQG
jgi:acyl-CoA thioester hydrolase